MKSSEIGLGETGRERALQLRDAAQRSMEASVHGQWIDPTLAQAALVMKLFLQFYPEIDRFPDFGTVRGLGSSKTYTTTRSGISHVP